MALPRFVFSCVKIVACSSKLFPWQHMIRLSFLEDISATSDQGNARRLRAIFHLSDWTGHIQCGRE